MRNIHILPTENSSRLSYNKDGVLELHRLQWRKNTQHIYITNSEEIKEGDWFIYKNEIIHRDKGKIDSMWVDAVKNGKKIILTTDQDLIKDGVQAIDDEFLEWFVKNSSCEFVKTELLNVSEVLWEEYFKKHGVYPKYPYYEKIIIPQEEPKQELKEETTSEGFHRIYKELDYREFDFGSFKIGVEWQKEQDKKLYSEEEVVSFIHKFLKEHQPQLPYLLGGINMWFGQYKKQFKKK
jgi:hypothetical protein